jgi:hypothetical protein
MSEWTSYSLRDLLLFSAQTYYRLFESYNAAIWPTQFLAAALGIAILVLLRRRTAGASRGISAILAAGWLWVGAAFLAKRYATINWSAMYFAWAFGIEAALLLWLGTAKDDQYPLSSPGRERVGVRGAVGLGVFLFALVVQPLIGPLLGRSWRGTQLFLLCPDPTAVATLGLLLLARARRRWPLMVVPILWCLYTAIFLFAMKASDWWAPPLAAGLAMVSTRFDRPRARDNR